MKENDRIKLDNVKLVSIKLEANNYFAEFLISKSDNCNIKKLWDSDILPTVLESNDLIVKSFGHKMSVLFLDSNKQILTNLDELIPESTVNVLLSKKGLLAIQIVRYHKMGVL